MVAGSSSTATLFSTTATTFQLQTRPSSTRISTAVRSADRSSKASSSFSPPIRVSVTPPEPPLLTTVPSAAALGRTSASYADLTSDNNVAPGNGSNASFGLTSNPLPFAIPGPERDSMPRRGEAWNACFPGYRRRHHRSPAAHSPQRHLFQIALTTTCLRPTTRATNTISTRLTRRLKTRASCVPMLRSPAKSTCCGLRAFSSPTPPSPACPCPAPTLPGFR